MALGGPRVHRYQAANILLHIARIHRNPYAIMRVSLIFLLIAAAMATTPDSDLARDLRARTTAARAAQDKRVEEARVSVVVPKVRALLQDEASKGNHELVVGGSWGGEGSEMLGLSGYLDWKEFPTWWNARYTDVPCSYVLGSCSLTHCNFQLKWSWRVTPKSE